MCDFNELPNKERLMYQQLWKEKDYLEHLLKCKIEARKSSNKPNSFYFKGTMETVDLLKYVFDIKNETVFDMKYHMATGGDGDESKKIRTLHSSSLCALLFFYNVTREHPLTLDLDGRVIKFTRSAFEFKSPVIKNASNMDVVLYGKEEKTGKKIVFLLESKFSEHYIDAETELKGISLQYELNEHSKLFYNKDFLSKLSLGCKEEPIKRKDKETVCITLYIKSEEEKVSPEKRYYIGGIKQMISHYVGMRNLEKNIFYGGKKSGCHMCMEEAIEEGADIILGEILFGDDVEIMKPATKRYSEKYKILAEEMNRILAIDGKTRLHVLKEDLSYSKLFKDKAYSVEEEIWQYYFGQR